MGACGRSPNTPQNQNDRLLGIQGVWSRVLNLEEDFSYSAHWNAKVAL